MAEVVDSLRDGLRLAEVLDDHGMQARFLAWLTVVASNGLRFADALGYARRAVAAARAVAPMTRSRSPRDSTG